MALFTYLAKRCNLKFVPIFLLTGNFLILTREFTKKSNLLKSYNPIEDNINKFAEYNTTIMISNIVCFTTNFMFNYLQPDIYF